MTWSLSPQTEVGLLRLSLKNEAFVFRATERIDRYWPIIIGAGCLDWRGRLREVRLSAAFTSFPPRIELKERLNCI
jgi:hypothetical protein